MKRPGTLLTTFSKEAGVMLAPQLALLFVSHCTNFQLCSRLRGPFLRLPAVARTAPRPSSRNLSWLPFTLSLPFAEGAPIRSPNLWFFSPATQQHLAIGSFPCDDSSAFRTFIAPFVRISFTCFFLFNALLETEDCSSSLFDQHPQVTGSIFSPSLWRH